MSASDSGWPCTRRWPSPSGPCSWRWCIPRALARRDAPRLREGTPFGIAGEAGCTAHRPGDGSDAAFVAVRLAGLYGDPNPWRAQATALATIIDFLNVTKNPPSLLFLLMTLGPVPRCYAHCGTRGRCPEAAARSCRRVPFAFYVAHLYLIHALAVAFRASLGFDAPVPDLQLLLPQGYGVGLPGVYVTWLLVIVALYPLRRWVAAVKARRREWGSATCSRSVTVLRKVTTRRVGDHARSPGRCILPRPMSNWRRRHWLLLAAVVFAAVPVSFGCIRAVTTGDDVRYLWTAGAALLGSMAAVRGRGGVFTPMSISDAGRSPLPAEQCVPARRPFCRERDRSPASRSCPSPLGCARVRARCRRCSRVRRTAKEQPGDPEGQGHGSRRRCWRSSLSDPPRAITCCEGQRKDAIQMVIPHAVLRRA